MDQARKDLYYRVYTLAAIASMPVNLAVFVTIEIGHHSEGRALLALHLVTLIVAGIVLIKDHIKRKRKRPALK